MAGGDERLASRWAGPDLHRLHDHLAVADLAPRGDDHELAPGVGHLSRLNVEGIALRFGLFAQGLIGAPDQRWRTKGCALEAE